MMDQLLERDAGGPEIIAEAIDHHMAGGGLDSTLDETGHDSQVIFIKKRPISRLNIH